MMAEPTARRITPAGRPTARDGRRRPGWVTGAPWPLSRGRRTAGWSAGPSSKLIPTGGRTAGRTTPRWAGRHLPRRPC